MASQEIFQTVYRGRQTALHHMAYVRMGKVVLIQQVLDEAGLDLRRKSVFDYGFGAGTFFRYCPEDTRIFGVELDSATVAEVRRMLERRGRKETRLEAIDIDSWDQHPLLENKYDVIVCSHVLEHLPDPVAFLTRIKQCLNAGGAFVGLVPINELRNNPHHVQTADRATIVSWLERSGLELRSYLEGDPWGYWIQPIFTFDAGLRHKLMHLLAQMVSLAIGVPATLLGYRRWATLSPLFARLTRSKASQAAFVSCRIS